MEQQDMDIMEIINMMEETIDKATTVPLTGKIMIEKDELLDYIQEIRLVYPDELKEAKWVKSERARILSEAESRAETIQKNATETQMQLINEHEIYRCAEQQAQEMLENARAEEEDARRNADEYVHDLIEDLERRVSIVLERVRQDKEEFLNS